MMFNVSISMHSSQTAKLKHFLQKIIGYPCQITKFRLLQIRNSCDLEIKYQRFEFVFNSSENLAKKGENTGNQQFLIL